MSALPVPRTRRGTQCREHAASTFGETDSALQHIAEEVLRCVRGTGAETSGPPRLQVKEAVILPYNFKRRIKAAIRCPY